MYEITLREIKKHKPCKDGWGRLLKNLINEDLDQAIPLWFILDKLGLFECLWALAILPEATKTLLLRLGLEDLVRSMDWTLLEPQDAHEYRYQTMRNVALEMIAKNITARYELQRMLTEKK